MGWTEMKICSFKKYKVVPSCSVCLCLQSLQILLENVIFKIPDSQSGEHGPQGAPKQVLILINL